MSFSSIPNIKATSSTATCLLRATVRSKSRSSSSLAASSTATTTFSSSSPCLSSLCKSRLHSHSLKSTNSIPFSRFSPSRNANLNRGNHDIGWNVSLSRKLSSTTSLHKTIKDAQHPTGFYYHSLPSSTDSNSKPTKLWAISILENPPKSQDSISILGHLEFKPELLDEDQENHLPQLVRNDPDLIKPNREFMRFLHQVLKKYVVPKDEVLAFEANMRGSGWAHLSDARHELMPGRIPTPDSIFSTVAFVDGKFCLDEQEGQDGYEINDTYRLVTKEEGPIQLRQEWLEIIRKRLEEVN